MRSAQRTLMCVIIGKFNPSIIHPYWFAMKKIARESEAKEAQVEVVHNQVSVFTLAGITVKAQSHQLFLSSTDETMWTTLKDWVHSIFTYLPETPVTALGINIDAEYVFSDFDTRDKFGHKLVDKSPWSGIVDSPKTRTIRIESKNPLDDSGYIWTTVEPSVNHKKGVVVQVNNHFNLHGNQFSGTDGIIKCVTENWDRVINSSGVIQKKVIELAEV